jgi:hypothetical protein
MYRALLVALAVSLLETSQLLAQTGPPNAIPPLPVVSPPPSNLTSQTAHADCPAIPDCSAIADCMNTGCCTGPRFWGSAEYLLWWTKNAPLPVPIVTTGDPTVGFPALNTAGAIGSNGTRVLLGDSNVNFGAFSGMRFTVGGWIDPHQVYGVEVSGFLLENLTNTWSASSNAAGNPPLYFPRFNNAAGFEDAVPISDPLRAFSGNVRATSALQLWGIEANSVLALTARPGIEIQALVGFRYLNLNESFQIDNTTNDLIFNNTTNLQDYFGTQNQFYGAQVGARAKLEWNHWSLDVTGQVAMGATVQTVDIQGYINRPGLGTFQGGMFAQPSNIGRTTNTDFGIIPSVDLKVGYQVTSHIGIFMGFTFLYWNQVVRPGDQIDRNVNLTQNAILDPNGVGKLVGPSSPSPQFNRTDFWAGGLNFGVNFKF